MSEAKRYATGGYIPSAASTAGASGAFLDGYNTAMRIRDVDDAKSAVWDAAIWLVLSLSLALGELADRSWLGLVWLGAAGLWVYWLVRSVRRLRRARGRLS